MLADDCLAQFGLEAMDKVRFFCDAIFDLVNVHLHRRSPGYTTVANGKNAHFNLACVGLQTRGGIGVRDLASP
jgi:hypothetical protein